MILSEKQKEYINNANNRYNFKVGARRCGKTYVDSLYMIPSRITERRGKKGLNVILGVSKGTIERNVLSLLRDIYGPKCIGNINSKNVAILFGEEVYCLGASKINQVAMIQGTSIKYCYGDEVAKWNKEVFEMVKSSLDNDYSVFEGALNPENKNHWFKKEFLDKIEKDKLDVYVQHFTIFDNPFLSKDFVKNICKEYQGTVYYKRYILGEWADAEGIIFPMVANNPDRYIQELKMAGFITIGIDWGGNKSKHAITATKISNKFDSIHYLKHSTLKATGTGTEQIFEWIINFVKEVQTRYGVIVGIFPDSAEQVLNNSLKNYLRKNGIGIPVKDCLKIPIEDRIHLMVIFHNLDKIKYIKNECNELIDAVSTCLFDEKFETDRWIDDGETSDIDSMDSSCYSWTRYYKQLSTYY